LTSSLVLRARAFGLGFLFFFLGVGFPFLCHLSKSPWIIHFLLSFFEIGPCGILPFLEYYSAVFFLGSSPRPEAGCLAGAVHRGLPPRPQVFSCFWSVTQNLFEMGPPLFSRSSLLFFEFSGVVFFFLRRSSFFSRYRFSGYSFRSLLLG